MFCKTDFTDQSVCGYEKGYSKQISTKTDNVACFSVKPKTIIVFSELLKRKQTLILFTCQISKVKPGHLLKACSIFKGKTFERMTSDH